MNAETRGGHRATILLLLGAVLLFGLVFWGSFAVIASSEWDLPIEEKSYGRDLRAFTGAGALAATRSSEDLYNPSATEYAGSDAAIYVNPPWYAIAMIPVSWIPFSLLYPLWLIVSVGVGAVSLRSLGISRWVLTILVALLTVSATYALFFGQNTFFMVGLLSVTVVSISAGSLRTSGVSLALLGFKPHLLLGFAVWWLLEFRVFRRAVAWLLGATAILVIGSALWLPGSWTGFIRAISDGEGLVSPAKEVSLLSAINLMLPDSGVAGALLSLATVVGVVAVLVLGLRAVRDDRYAAACITITASLLIAPHVLAYDWLLLLVAGAALFQSRFVSGRELVMVGLMLALVVPVGDGLTTVQLDSFGRAVHLAPLALFAVFLWLTSRVSGRTAPGLVSSVVA